MYKIKFGCDESKVEKVMDTIKDTLKEDNITVTFTSDYFFFYAIFHLDGYNDYSSTLNKLASVLTYLQKKNIVDYFFIEEESLMEAMC